MKKLSTLSIPLKHTNSRQIPYEPHVPCDNCGSEGSYDFMGDNLCEKCFAYVDHVATDVDPGDEAGTLYPERSE